MGPGSIWRCLTSSISIPIIKIRRRHDLRILIMESLYLERPLYRDWPLDPDRDLEHPHSLKTGYLHHFRKDVPRIPWWRHQMETFSALLALCAGTSPVPVNSPHKCQWRRALMFSFICASMSDWVNNREAGDLRRHCGHYDVSVMVEAFSSKVANWQTPAQNVLKILSSRW